MHVGVSILVYMYSCVPVRRYSVHVYDNSCVYILPEHRCGPLSQLWCMRFEAKHRYFKQVAKVIGNFKNIAKTLASRHQRYMCYVLSSPGRFLQDELEVGPGMHL